MAEYYKLDADLIVHTETEHYKISKGQYAIKRGDRKVDRMHGDNAKCG